MPSTIAVLPTPGSPISTGLFFVRRERISIVCSISSARPITGSSLPSRASSREVAAVLVERRRLRRLRAAAPSTRRRGSRLRAASCATGRSAAADARRRTPCRAPAPAARARVRRTTSRARAISSYAASSAAFASGESDGATSVRPPRSASSSTCAAIASGIAVDLAARGGRGRPAAPRTAGARCRGRGCPTRAPVCAARRRSSRVASLKNCVMSTRSTCRRGAAVRLARRRPAPRAAEEVGEELVEQAAPPKRLGHPLLGEVDLAQVLGLLRVPSGMTAPATPPPDGDAARRMVPRPPSASFGSSR